MCKGMKESFECNLNQIQNPNQEFRKVFEDWKHTIKEMNISKLSIDNETKGKDSFQKSCFLHKCFTDLSTIRSDESNGNYKFTLLHGNVCFDKFEIEIIQVNGTYDGKSSINGMVELINEDNILQAPVSDSCIHGLLKVLRCKLGPCAAENDEMTETPSYLDELIFYSEDSPDPNRFSWWFPDDGGAIYCTPNKDRQAEGKDCIYLYPDIKVGLVGQWRNGLMVTGHPARLKGFSIMSGMLQPKMEIIQDRQTYTFFQSNSTSITPDLMLSDIYEDMNIEIKPSKIPYAGEGVFAKTEFKEEDIIAFYSGLIGNAEDSPASAYSSVSTLMTWDNKFLHVPREYQSRKNFRASSGHKVNHGENGDVNAFLRHCETARFGKITCVFAGRDITPGEEILYNYGYKP